MWCNHVSLKAKRVAASEALGGAFMCWNIPCVSQIYSSNKQPPKIMKIGQILVRKVRNPKKIVLPQLNMSSLFNHLKIFYWLDMINTQVFLAISI